MGRRAADPTTPVPVLGVPASVGVRGWKTTGGDRSGGPLLQTWGHCNIGVQTSPGVGRPPAQLADDLFNSISQTSTGCIGKETGDILLLTTNNNEKKAILRQKTGENKVKKEVTFISLRGDASKDGGTYCYARAIRTNPLARTKLKCAARYMNGSVVDSEAIGGISVVNDEVEPVMAANSQEKLLHHPKADQSGKMLPLSATRPSALPQNTCNSGKQFVTCRTAFLGMNTPNPDANLREKPLTSLFPIQFQVPHANIYLQQKQQRNSDRKTQITLNPKISHLNEELRCQKIPHPACPVHSRGNVAASIKSPAILHAKTTTVTKATIEHFTEPPPESKPPLIRSLTLTPRVTAAKTTSLHSHTFPKLLKTTDLTSAQDNVPKNITVSMHTTPDNTSPPSYLSTLAMRPGNTSCTDTHKTHTSFNQDINPCNFNLNTEETLHLKSKIQVNKASNITNSSQATPKCFTSSSSTNYILKSDLHQQLTPARPSPDPSEKPPLTHCQPSAGKMSLIDAVVSPAQFPALTNPPAPYSHLSTAVSQSTLNHKANPDQIPETSIKYKSVSPQIYSAQPKTSTSGPTFHTSLHKASASNSKAELPEASSAAAASPDTLKTNVTCGRINFHLNKTAGSSLSPLMERTNHVSVSSKTNVPQCNGVADSSSVHRTQTANVRHQESTEPRDRRLGSRQEKNSGKVSLLPSEQQNVFESSYKGDAKSSIKKYSGQNKVSCNLINELVINESKDHERSNRSHVTSPQDSLIKSSSSSLQGCLNSKQQRLPHNQGCTETKYERHCAKSPPVKTDTNTQQFPEGATANHANSKLNLDRQTQSSNSSPSATTQTNCENIVSHTKTQVRAVSKSPACQNPNFITAFLKQTHTSPEHSVTASFNSADTDPECDSIQPISMMFLASSPCIQSDEAEATCKPETKFSPCVHQTPPEDTSLAHSHPVDAALVLPTSPQCCRSAALEQRLRAVEASLAANKDRITTLLNIIHELEAVSTPSSRRRCCKTGLELKNCSTCQKTACIVYSVEYDFRQQERNFSEVLNHSGGNNSTFSVHLTLPLNFRLLRNVIIKNFTKTKLKSKKLCKTLLKWLPKKIPQL